MDYKIEISQRGRFISVPCKAIDNIIKTTSGEFYKILLYILSAENDNISTQQISVQTGVDPDTVDNAVLFWKNAGIISIGASVNEPSIGAIDKISPYADNSDAESHTKYSSKEIADIINSNLSVKLMFDQLELALGRELRYSERCGYLNLYEYYGFEVQSIIILAMYCISIGKGSMKYVESVAKTLFQNGMTSYKDIEAELQKMAYAYTYESKVKRLIGISSNLSSKQSQIVKGWSDKSFSDELILKAYDITLDNLGKFSFPYMNKILDNWDKSGVKTPGDIEKLDSKPKKEKSKRETSYDIDDYERFSINFLSDSKEGKN